MASDTDTQELSIGPLEVSPRDGRVRVSGHDVTVTGYGLSILVLLAQRAGDVVRRDDLYREIWGAPLRAGDRTIDVKVVKLRRRLEQALPGWVFIHTHPGWGYCLMPQRKAARHKPAAATRGTRCSPQHHDDDENVVRVGNLELWPRQGQARAAGKPIWLTPLETALLHILMATPSYIVDKARIYEHLSAATGLPVTTTSAGTYVRRVRIKLAAAAPGWTYIHTQHGRGYWLEPGQRRSS